MKYDGGIGPELVKNQQDFFSHLDLVFSQLVKNLQFLICFYSRIYIHTVTEAFFFQFLLTFFKLYFNDHHFNIPFTCFFQDFMQSTLNCLCPQNV